MNVLAIIPARGGSKGIPRKNVRVLAGRPLLGYSIEHALRSETITRVVVSTDDAAIAAVARAGGAEVVHRPAELSGDTASSESALLHTLDVLREEEGYEPDLVVFLQATSPLRPAEAIDGAVRTLLADEADSLFSACSLHGFLWRHERGARTVTSFSYDHQRRPRRQDAPEDLVENGSIYVFKPWVLRENANRLGGRISIYRMGPLESVQIDEPHEFQLVEDLLKSPVIAARYASMSTPDFSAIRLLVLDFDGVMTDNRVLVDQDGREAVFCHRGDGWGLARLREAGVEVVVLSTETNPVVTARCRKLGLDATQDCDDKRSILQALAEERGLRHDEVAFIGNDENDLAGLQWVGLPIAVADAVPSVRAAARHVTIRAGGDGAIREICDVLIASKRQDYYA